MANAALQGLDAISAPILTTDELAIARDTDRLTKVTVGDLLAKNPNLTDNGVVTTSGGDGTLAVVATTGSGNVVLATSAALTTPNIGTPSAGTLTNCDGLPVDTGISGLGTGVATALAVNTGSAGAVVLFNGALGTPSSGTLTNATGLPIASGVSGLGTNVATALAVNVGSSGAFVVLGGALGTPSSGTLTNCTFPTLNQNTTGSAASLSISGQTGLLTVTGLASTNRVKTVRDAADTILELGGSYTPTGTWTSLTLVTPALGTPASGTLTNCSGLPASALVAGTLPASSAFTFGENTELKLDAALSADGKYCGITEAGTAGATLAFGDLVYLAAADSRWELTDASAASTSGDVKLGICVLAAASDGDPTTILLWGKIRADTAFPSFTVSAPVHISETAGDVVVSAPTTTDSVTRRVGWGNDANELFFCPSNDYYTHT